MVPMSPTSTMTIRVYDPPMCCSTGICGPGIDKTLIQVARDLRWFESQGVHVKRFNLAQQPEDFLAQSRVAGLMQAFDEKALPIILLNDEIFVYGRYPSREELLAALQKLPQPGQPPRPTSAPKGGCCDGGTDCCE